jgi:predicted ATPase/DNA-binding NarL/FixJ family response regulator
MVRRPDEGALAAGPSPLRLVRDARLPAPVTRLIGRDEAIVAVRDLLTSARLVTLTGPGGIGKTRLALAVAERLQDGWRDGSVFVALQSITDPQVVASAIAQALGVRESGSHTVLDSLRAALQSRHLLLVLDNFEHVLPAAPLITELLAACPELTVLVTSRATLHLYGERVYPVPPLDLPDLDGLPTREHLAEAEAIQLFVERARAATPSFDLTTDNAPIVAAICARVDSLPLAIELAAARVRVHSPAALLARLERRLTVLTGGPRDVPIRQQTMRDTIAWSYELLTTDEQRLFRRLSVFAGGWTLEAAEAVGGSDPIQDAGRALEVIDGLSTLIDQSLVRQITQPDGSTRYTMLETLREYGHDRLAEHGEADAVFERHAGYFLTMVEAAAPRLDGNEQLPLSNQLADDLDNLRATLEWLYLSGDAQRGLCMVGHLRQFWYRRGHYSEGRAQAARFLDLPDAVHPTPCRALALATAAWLAHWQGSTAATAHAEEALAIWRTIGDERHVPFLLLILGLTADLLDNDLERAQSYFEQSLAIARTVGDTVQIARSLSNLGELARRQGDADRALALIEESMHASGDAGQMQGYALALGTHVRVSLERNDLDRAAELAQEQLRLFSSRDDQWGILMAFHHFAIVAVARKQPAVAVRSLSAADRLQEMTGIMSHPLDRSLLDKAQSDLREMLGDAAYVAAWEQARTRSLAEAVAEALAVTPASTSAHIPEAQGGLRHGLTPRETEVLRLIAAGRSNNEIATELFISVRTVERHITNLYTKIDARGKADATAWALRHGLA